MAILLQDPSPPPTLLRKAMPPAQQLCGRRRKLVSPSLLGPCVSPTVVEPDHLALSPQRRQQGRSLRQVQLPLREPPAGHNKRRMTGPPQRRKGAPGVLDHMRVHSLQQQQQQQQERPPSPPRPSVVRFDDSPPAVWTLPPTDEDEADLKSRLYYSPAEIHRFLRAETARKCAQHQYQQVLYGDLSALLLPSNCTGKTTRGSRRQRNAMTLQLSCSSDSSEGRPTSPLQIAMKQQQRIAALPLTATTPFCEDDPCGCATS